MPKSAFTLIELLVVIAIIGILSTLSVVSFNSARQKSRDTRRVADIRQIQTALEMYAFNRLDGLYPITSSANIQGFCLDGSQAGFVASCGEPIFLKTKIFYYFASPVNYFEKPSFIIDISKEIEMKVEALKCYESQFGKNIQINTQFDNILNLNRYYGMLIGKKFGESFITKETIKHR